MKKIIFFGLLFLNIIAFAQNNTGNYIDSLQKFRYEYIATHDVVKGADTVFLKFFPIDDAYRTIAVFEKIDDTIGFGMESSSGRIFKYFKYGRVTFILKNKVFHLFLYQAQWMMKMDQYKNYLFMPFTDSTCGYESHGSGRFIDFTMNDIKNNLIELDFNKAYNPSCAYGYDARYSCPIPPKENDIALTINAGEKYLVNHTVNNNSNFSKVESALQQLLS